MGQGLWFVDAGSGDDIIEPNTYGDDYGVD